ncbi:MAG: dienelactone hydrolase family protein [Acidimicrobiales bacterium]
MDHLQRYLADEVAEDHTIGRLTRREALRRLSLLGLTSLGASALLAACANATDSSEDQPSAPPSPGEPETARPLPSARSSDAIVTTEAITYPGRGVTLQGAFAAPTSSPRGAVMVIHENRGLSDFIRSITGRLAGDGYTALAVDLLSAEGGTAAFADEAAIGPALTRLASERSVDDMRSTLDELQRRQPAAKLAVIGFCFGGGMVWELLKDGDPRIAAAVPFYGPVADPDFSGSEAAVLAVYAEGDQRVNATRDAAAAALEQAGLVHDIRTFPGVGHAFVRSIDDPADPASGQARTAYETMLDWFARFLH